MVSWTEVVVGLAAGAAAGWLLAWRGQVYATCCAEEEVENSKKNDDSVANAPVQSVNLGVPCKMVFHMKWSTYRSSS